MKICLRYQIVALTALLFAGSFFTGAVSADSDKNLIIAGTGSSIGVMQRIAGAFQKKHPGVTVAILPSIGSTGGIKAVKEGKIDIGLSARSLKVEERSVEMVEEFYGHTGFVFGVQESDPTNDLTLAEIEEIYTGTRKTWPDGTPIRLILRPAGDTYSVYLAGINPGMKSASEKARSIPGVFVGITDQDAALQIEKTPGSFGATSSSIIAAEKRKIKALSVDGVTPALSNVSTGKYPFSMTMSLVYKRNQDKEAVKDFVEFVFSRDGRKLLSENGHVPLRRITRK